MEVYCDHNHDSDYDDDKLLLDDENTIKIKSCTKCSKPKFLNGFTNPMLNTTVAIGNNSHEQSSNSLDSPLLETGHYSDFENAHLYDFHCHTNNSSKEDSTAWKKLISVSLLCLLFMITELIGGYLAGSLAVMTDAAHLFSDLVGFLVSISSIWIGKKNSTRIMTFGYQRVEVVGAFISILVVWLLAGIFCVIAIGRLLRKDYQVDSDTMLIVASIGVIVNILMGAVLHGICHTHSHGIVNHTRTDNINVRAAAAHVLGDLLQSVGVLIAAIIIKVFPGAQIADPICTLLFSVVVVYTTIRVAYDAIKILLQASPKLTVDFTTLFMKISGVKHVHEVHVWSLAPGKDVVTVHIAVDQYCDRDVILKKATCLMRNYLNVVSCTIQIEKYNEELIQACSECQKYC